MGIRPELFFESLPFLLKGAVTTVYVSILVLILGLTIGLFMGMGRLSKIRPVRWGATAYVEFIRGTPVYVQILILAFGLPSIGITLPAIVAGVLAMGINSGAYVAEIVRAGIQSIERGQMEAARSLGMTYVQAMRFIILPQAFRRILPPLGNEFVVLIKDSSLVSVIGISELMMNASLVAARTYQYFTMYLGAAFIYFILTFAASNLVGYIERRLAVE